MEYSQDFQWSSKAYTPLQLIQKFDTKFPLVVIVKEGYHGENAWESLSQSQVFGLHDWGFHQRVVCRDSQKRYYSIPVTYPATFRTKKKSGSLREMLDKNTLPLDIEMESSGEEMGDTGDTLVQLQAIDTYQERYIKGNLLQNGTINKTTIIIPIHLEVTFLVSRPGKQREDWRQSSWQMMDDVARLPVDDVILHYSGSMVENMVRGDFNKEVFYESLQPLRVSTYSRASTSLVLPAPDCPRALIAQGESLASLTMDQVVQMLHQLSLEQYSDAFRKKCIDGVLLKELTLEDCTCDLGMRSSDAKRLLPFVSGWSTI